MCKVSPNVFKKGLVKTVTSSQSRGVYVSPEAGLYDYPVASLSVTATGPISGQGDTGGKAGLLMCKHDHYTPARKMRRDVRALTAHNHPEGRFYPQHISHCA